MSGIGQAKTQRCASSSRLTRTVEPFLMGGQKKHSPHVVRYVKDKSTAKREVLYCSPNCVISDPAQGDLL
jgi:hypothetical protein